MKQLFFVYFLIIIFGFTQNSSAQILDNLIKKTEKKVEKETEKRAENQINKGVDAAFDETEKQLKGDNKEGQDTKVNNTQTKEQSGQNKDQTVTETQETQQNVITSKYDFIPGEKVIFFDDFSSENVGDFPVSWNTNGSGEIVTTSLYPGHWFKITDGNATVWNDVPLDLPENYTIEFDAVPQKRKDGHTNYTFHLIASEKPKEFDPGSAPGKGGISVSFEFNTYFVAHYTAGRGKLNNRKDGFTQKLDKKYHIAIWVQKERIRVYQDEDKLFDLPKAMDLNVKYNKIRFEGGTPLITNVRVATGLPDMRSKLITEGKLVSYGIYFDVNKDVVKKESYGTLKEIAKVLTENPDVKVKIVGHTDSDGDDKSNLDLSKRRGESVKNFLAANFNIDSARLESDGKGETEPVAPNDSATNKALNRRVEFIKL